MQKIRDYPDGRMDIVVEGRAVFRLTELLDEKEYYEGMVEYLRGRRPASIPILQERPLAGLRDNATCFSLGQPWPTRRRPTGDSRLSDGRRTCRWSLTKRQALLEMRNESRPARLFSAGSKLSPELAGSATNRKRTRATGSQIGHALHRASYCGLSNPNYARGLRSTIMRACTLDVERRIL